MSDAIELPKPVLPESAATTGEPEPSGSPKKRGIVDQTAHRERPVTNLGRVFGQFAELQQQIADQVVALEDSVNRQRQDVVEAMTELPELREKIDWLIASFYEQSKKDESIRERLNRQDATIATLVEAVRAIHQAQTRWQSVVEEILGILTRANAAPIPPLPDL